MVEFIIGITCVITALIFYATSMAICIGEGQDLFMEIGETEEKEKLVLNYFHPIETIFLYVFITITTLTPLVNCIMAEIYHSDKTYDIIMNIIRKRDKKMKIRG